VQAAVEDAGLERSDSTASLVNPGLTWGDLGMGSFQPAGDGPPRPRLSATMSLGGATAGAMIQHAARASPPASATVACVFSDAPLKPRRISSEREDVSGAAYAFARGWERGHGYAA
jgi:hypothetical protein